MVEHINNVAEKERMLEALRWVERQYVERQPKVSHQQATCPELVDELLAKKKYVDYLMEEVKSQMEDIKSLADKIEGMAGER